jgi:putative aminopeptidase FrvX
MQKAPESALASLASFCEHYKLPPPVQTALHTLTYGTSADDLRRDLGFVDSAALTAAGIKPGTAAFLAKVFAANFRS